MVSFIYEFKGKKMSTVLFISWTDEELREYLTLSDLSSINKNITHFLLTKDP